MALGITFLKQYENSSGKLREAFFDIAFDASYPSGGEVFDENTIPGKMFKAIAGVEKVGGNAAAGAYLLHWDTANKKLMIFYPTGGATSPAALADPVVAVTVPAGLTNVTSDAAQPNLVEVLTPGRGEELLATTDASTLTFRIRVIGF